MRTASRRNSSVYFVAMPYLLHSKHCLKETGTKPRHCNVGLCKHAARRDAFTSSICKSIQPNPKTPITSYSHTIKHERLDQNIFETIEKTQNQAMKWLSTYNYNRPNMAIDLATPALKRKMVMQLYKRTLEKCADSQTTVKLPSHPDAGFAKG